MDSCPTMPHDGALNVLSGQPHQSPHSHDSGHSPGRIRRILRARRIKIQGII